MEESVYNMLEIFGVIIYALFGVETWCCWKDASPKKRYHLFWYLVFLPVTLSFSAGKWLYNFMKKDL